MSYSNFSRQKKIPSITTRKSSPMTTNFAKGIYTYKPNDTMGLDEIRLAQDARFDRVGEYGTRLGYKRLSTPIGYASYKATAVASGNSSAFSRLDPYSFSATGAATICSVIFSVKRYSTSFYDENMVGRATLLANGNVKSQAYFKIPESTSLTQIELYFNDAPAIANNDTISVEFGLIKGDPAHAGIQVQSATGDASKQAAYTLKSCTAGCITNVFEANIDGT